MICKIFANFFCLLTQSKRKIWKRKSKYYWSLRKKVSKYWTSIHFPLRLRLELIHQVNILFHCLPLLKRDKILVKLFSTSHFPPHIFPYWSEKTQKNFVLFFFCREQQLHKSDDEKISTGASCSPPSPSVDDLPMESLKMFKQRAFTFPNLKNLGGNGRIRTVSERAEEKDQVKLHFWMTSSKKVACLISCLS